MTLKRPMLHRTNMEIKWGEKYTLTYYNIYKILKFYLTKMLKLLNIGKGVHGTGWIELNDFLFTQPKNSGWLWQPNSTGLGSD